MILNYENSIAHTLKSSIAFIKVFVKLIVQLPVRDRLAKALISALCWPPASLKIEKLVSTFEPLIDTVPSGRVEYSPLSK